MRHVPHPAVVAAAAVAVLGGCAPDAVELPASLGEVGFDTLYQIGATDGPSWERFQGVWDVELDGSGRLALLDLGGPAVHVYDADGDHLASLEDVGLEEGRIDGPTGIAWASDGVLAVWDPGASWISTFRATGPELRFVERRRAFAFGETGFCAADGRTFVSYFGFQDGNVVHEIGAEGPVRSFGPAPDVAGADGLGPELREIAVEELTPSALLCTPAGVLDVSFVQARLRLHDVEGGPVWSRTFEAFRPIVVYSPDGIGLGRDFDEDDGSHLLRSVVPWGPAAVLVQHELRTREVPEPGTPEVFESRLIRLEDGTELDRTRSLPLVLAAHGNRLVLGRVAPVPGVTVVEVR